MRQFLPEFDLIMILEIMINYPKFLASPFYTFDIKEFRPEANLIERAWKEYGITIERPSQLDSFFKKQDTKGIHKPSLGDLYKEADRLGISTTQLGLSVQLTLQFEEDFPAKIKTFLDQYISDYENGDLYIPGQNVFVPKEHFSAFKWIIGDFTEKYGTKNIFVNQDISSRENPRRYRLLEFFLLMEKKGFIRIKAIHPNGGKAILKWDLTIDILRDYNELDALYNDWIQFGDLSFRPKSGHARRGKNSYVFKSETNGYKVLLGLMTNPNKQFDVTYIAKNFLNEPETVDAKQASRIVHDAIHKQIRPKLGLPGENVRVDIICCDNKYTLTALPNVENSTQAPDSTPIST